MRGSLVIALGLTCCFVVIYASHVTHISSETKGHKPFNLCAAYWYWYQTTYSLNVHCKISLTLDWITSNELIYDLMQQSFLKKQKWVNYFPTSVGVWASCRTFDKSSWTNWIYWVSSICSVLYLLTFAIVFLWLVGWCVIVFDLGAFLEGEGGMLY